MFLHTLRARNPAFIESAIALHQAGRIPANSYVIDLDTVRENARHFCAAAHQRDFTVYAMTKQVGRAPAVLDAMARGGCDGFVAVDMACARPIVAAGHVLGHLGHLVQIPRGEAAEAARLKPQYWTIFSANKAAEASAAAVARGRRQDILLRVWAAPDIFYPGHEGGFSLEELPAAIARIQSMPGLRFAGVTTFPALLFDQVESRVKSTPNAETLLRAAEIARAHSDAAPAVNAPGTNSAAVLPLLAEAGATQVEPGHALTGSTPLHAVQELPERPAALYLTEVAHVHCGTPLCFGGGFYVDPVFAKYAVRAVVAGDAADAARAPVALDMPDPAGIDYYARLHPPAGRKVREGDSVIAGFRMQAFVTRANVVGLAGVQSGHAEVAGVCDVYGRAVQIGDAGDA